MRAFFFMVALVCAGQAQADSPDLRKIVETHIVAGYETLAQQSAALADVAATSCDRDGPDLAAAYHKAFDAWVAVSHLRFGPSEIHDRAFSIAYWPDPRGSTPRTLAALIKDEDPAVYEPAEFASVSVAGRGFYALEFLLFDPAFDAEDKAAYQCALVRAVTVDIATNARTILEDWQTGYGSSAITPDNDTFHSEKEVSQQFFTALLGGLEFTSALRLGRPLGTFERPRPNRAEAHRSGRSLRHVIVSLDATGQLAALISGDDHDVAQAFAKAQKRAAELDDPIFAGVTNPQGRIRVEALQQSVDAIRETLATQVGPRLGIAAGFNSLDGD